MRLITYNYLLTIVLGVYRPTNMTGGLAIWPHIVSMFLVTPVAVRQELEISLKPSGDEQASGD